MGHPLRIRFEFFLPSILFSLLPFADSIRGVHVRLWDEVLLRSRVFFVVRLGSFARRVAGTDAGVFVVTFHTTY